MSSEPLDTAALLKDLAGWWASIKPRLPAAADMSMMTAATATAHRTAVLGAYMDRYRREVPLRIAGSEWDQPIPEGIQNPYWEVVRQLPLEDLPSAYSGWRPEPSTYYLAGGADVRRVPADRFALCGTYSWSICSPGDIAWLKGILAGRGVVEPGAGTGYWAWQMEQAGISVAAYEPNPPGENHFAYRTWTTLLNDDHSAPKHHPDRALFLCWPNYGAPWAAQALSCYSGDMLIYAGEPEGGCTADDEFYRLLEAEWDEIEGCPSHVSYWGIHCYLTAYRRKDGAR
jgi:hypothetical protein